MNDSGPKDESYKDALDLNLLLSAYTGVQPAILFFIPLLEIPSLLTLDKLHKPEPIWSDK